ncbi:ligand-effect modulator 3 family [Pelagophyceae sp. CCMP2097]|nr:ligand-effect modulator 3 family [Pelagophyceae sp. CCMP2097]|mmetsp:Transcript_19946/g.67542  ORF Transcript_19946/g.67542 Transcript_19946/m.67542 type:complete len:404 (+) Transcript_19946:183-1394(+)
MGLLMRRKPSGAVEVKTTKRPDDTDIKQQRLRAWNPVMTPKAYVGVFFVLGALFIIIGVVLGERQKSLVVQRKQYDGPGTPESNADCKIRTADAGVRCTVTLDVDEKMEGPLHVFYEIDNFYQNHRRYAKSMSWPQLNRGKVWSSNLVKDDCYPLVKNGSKVLHPCGVVANTLFNDVIKLVRPLRLSMKENNIAWKTDLTGIYTQPQGFEWMEVDVAATANCEDKYCPEAACTAEGITPPCSKHVCRGGYYDRYTNGNGDVVQCAKGQHVLFHYKDPENQQYLYETFPQVISPIVGVRNEHFAVWMKTAGLPQFRKLYGRINDDVSKDTRLVFDIENNFDVHAFGGRKYIVVSTLQGFQNGFLAVAYLVVGILAVGFGVLFAVLQCISPRKMGDPRHIPWLQQ